MSTHRSSESLQFSNLGRRKVVAKFDGGRMSSDAGALLLREVNARCDLISRLAVCFTDYRDPSRVERLLAQRIFGWCLGYEDLNDHDRPFEKESSRAHVSHAAKRAEFCRARAAGVGGGRRLRAIHVCAVRRSAGMRIGKTDWRASDQLPYSFVSVPRVWALLSYGA